MKYQGFDEHAVLYNDPTKPFNHPDNQQGKIVQSKTGSTVTTIMPTGDTENPTMAQTEPINSNRSLTDMINHQGVLPATQPE